MVRLMTVGPLKMILNPNRTMKLNKCIALGTFLTYVFPIPAQFEERFVDNAVNAALDRIELSGE